MAVKKTSATAQIGGLSSRRQQGGQAFNRALPVDHLRVVVPLLSFSATPFNFTVGAKDAMNDTVHGYSGVVTFASSDTDMGITLPGNYTFTPSDNGIHVFSATLVTAGGQTITVTDLATASITGTSNEIDIQL